MDRLWLRGEDPFRRVSGKTASDRLGRDKWVLGKTHSRNDTGAWRLGKQSLARTMDRGFARWRRWPFDELRNQRLASSLNQRGRFLSLRCPKPAPSSRLPLARRYWSTRKRSSWWKGGFPTTRAMIFPVARWRTLGRIKTALPAETGTDSPSSSRVPSPSRT